LETGPIIIHHLEGVSGTFFDGFLLVASEEIEKMFEREPEKKMVVVGFCLPG
jgi:hypothetical protein